MTDLRAVGGPPCGAPPAPALFPETQICSGRGVGCAREDGGATRCVCADPSRWTGQGDLLFGSETCAISVQAVAGLCAVLAVVAVGAFLATVRYAHVNYTRQKLRGRPVSKLGVSLGLGGLVSSTCFASLGVYHAACPTCVVGTDIAATTLICLGCLGFTAMNMSYNCFLFYLGMSHAGIKDQILKRRLALYGSMHMLLALLDIASIFALLSQDKEIFDAMVPLFMIGHAVLTLFIAALFIFVAPKVTDSIKRKVGARANEGALKEILLRIERITYSTRYSSLFVVFISILFLAWKGLRLVAYPYVFTVIWILSQVFQIQCMMSLCTIFNVAAKAMDQRRPQLRSQRAVVDGNTDEESSSVGEFMGKNTQVMGELPLASEHGPSQPQQTSSRSSRNSRPQRIESGFSSVRISTKTYEASGPSCGTLELAVD